MLGPGLTLLILQGVDFRALAEKFESCYVFEFRFKGLEHSNFLKQDGFERPHLKVVYARPVW